MRVLRRYHAAVPTIVIGPIDTLAEATQCCGATVIHLDLTPLAAIFVCLAALVVVFWVRPPHPEP
jgi:hypothetical protein